MERPVTLPVGAIRPAGWMLEQMRRDLEHGFVGRLDRLAPEQMLEDDIYHRDRLTRQVRRKDVGTHTTGAEWEVQFLWWNSESQSNWWDGFLRHAVLTGDRAVVRERIEPYVREKLASADQDGYLGIYGPDLRYRHQSENGELWAQATLFRALLAWYEFSADATVLEAVRRAMHVTMRAWPAGNSEPFRVTEPHAGTGHGLMIADVLDSITRLTGDMRYRDYAVFLFEDYCRHELPEVDIRPGNLLDPDYRFQGHGVHSYEHLRALVIAAYHTQKPEYHAALAAYLEKLEFVLTASGAPIGDEWILGRGAHPSNTGYEYCSLQELLHSYSLLLEKTGDAKWADRIEWLFYNAAQGARHPEGRSICYLKTDNAFHAMGQVHMHRPQDEERVKYSPVHRDVAICCVPNAGRIHPYFLQAMYHRTAGGLAINLYGASEVRTVLDGSEVRIRQCTDYPFEDTVRIEVECSPAATFELRLRVPEWAADVELEGVSFGRNGNWLEIGRSWNGRTRLDLRFTRIARILEHAGGTRSVGCGPLLYALPISHREIRGADYGEAGFHDIYAQPSQAVVTDWRLPGDAAFEAVTGAGGDAGPFFNPLLRGRLYNGREGRFHPVELVPMGSTVLRQVSFQPAIVSIRENL
jgi:DUF1680 family protein